jgi:hypothetical protein
MIIVIINIIMLFILIIIYKSIDKALSKSLFYDVSVLWFYVVFVSPLTLSIANFFIIIMFVNKHYWFLSLIPMLLPILFFLWHMISKKRNKKKYELIKHEIFPFIISKLQEGNFDITENDIKMVYYRENNSKHIDITLLLNNIDQDVINFILELEKLLMTCYKDIITTLHIEKKNKNFIYQY